MNSKYVSSMEDREIKFPCLMEYDNGSGLGKYIVLFSNKNCGTVVYSENKERLIGKYSDILNIDYFNFISGDIILKN